MRINKILLVSACLVFAFTAGCSKIEDAAESTRKKGNEAFKKVVIDPKNKALAAQKKMNAALENMEKSIERATGDTQEKIDEAAK